MSLGDAPKTAGRDFVLVPLADLGAGLLPDGHAPGVCDGVVHLGPLRH